MRKFIYGLLLCVIILTGCSGGAKKTDTPAAPAHNIPPAVYPGAKSGGPVDANQPYPGPRASSAYPGPNTSGGAASAANPFAPTAADDQLARGEAFVETADSQVTLMESNPPQVKLHLKGSLPNPCHQLRVNPTQPDAQNKIQVEVYSVVKPDEMCTEVLKEFDEEIPLGSFPAGHYSVYVNGELVGEFDA